MEIKLKPGKYVVAISGGVDSMVLLHLLKSRISSPKSQLVVAHFDHGIHRDSAVYCEFVASSAKKMNLKFASERGDLGPDASEAQARKSRYLFLEHVKDKYDSDAILTAHHQDDLIETIFINILRGTNRKGLSSLRSGDRIIRPLLGYSKKQIINHAKRHNIVWREDPTNVDEKYLRNYLRLKVLPEMSEKTRQKLLEIAEDSKIRNEEIKDIIANITSRKNDLDRKIFVGLDHASSKEVLADYLNRNGISFDSKLLEQCVNFIKTAKTSKKFMISKNYYFEIQDDKVKLNLL